MGLKAKALIGGGVIAAFALAVGGTYGYNRTFNYSEGVRTGEVDKVSLKGSLCKTWEGQLNLDNVALIDGQGSQLTPLLQFSVEDEKLAKRLQELSETKQHVGLEYRQIKWKTTHAALTASCQMDTEYIITGVKVLDSASTAGGGVVPYVNVPGGQPAVQPRYRR